MRILIVTPRQARETGNRITAERHRQGLAEFDHRVEIVETDADPASGDRLGQEVETFRPDLVHLLHAYRAGAPWLATPAAGRVPFVVTLTGTDLHHGLSHPTEGAVIREVLSRAAAVITQNVLSFENLRAASAAFVPRLRYLPPGIVLGIEPYPLRQRLGISPESILFLHPAGVRPVKRNLELLQLFDVLAEQDARLRVVFCGPALDASYAGRFDAAVAERPWAAWAGVIPSAAMADALRQADVVLNHSESEGLSNALLEAAALGRPILARAIPGNAAVVENGRNGILYHDDAEFTRCARALLEDPELRRRLSYPHPEAYDPERESEELLKIYDEALSRGVK